ncbi:MAG: prolyl oligopeptidase family serine peptidase [Bryobacterales bacterium]|nr:prolyl oligopeptidase family serine peptidase [Bryobacterales bacterium]
MKRHLALCLAHCLLGIALSAFSFATTWTTDDILLMERAASLELSRDGTMAVWAQSKMDTKKGTAVSQIYLRYLADNHLVQLTRGDESSSAPQFSPNGKQVAFLSSRKAAGSDEGGSSDGPKQQVWLLDLRGGEPRALTSMAQGVNTFRWLNDDALLLVAAEDSSALSQQTKKDKDTSRVVDDPHVEPVRLFRFSLKDKTAKRLTQNADRITRVDVSWDGKYAVTLHARSSRYVYDQLVPPATILHDFEKGTAEPLFPNTRMIPGEVQFRFDNAGFYFTAAYSTHPVYTSGSIDKLYYFDLAARSHREMDLSWENGVGSGIAPVEDGIVVSLANGVRDVLARYRMENGALVRQNLTGQHAANVTALRSSMQNGLLAYDYSTASVPGQWYAAKLNGAALEAPKQITEINAGLAKKTIAKTETVRWRGALDEEVEGILYYPHNYDAGKKYPLVVMIHGGPSGVDRDAFRESWAYPHQLYTQRGAFLLKPNYHGSSNYGLKWVESISRGKYNDLEWIDVEKGVDALIAKGLVDPAQMGIMGWSNGSIISIEISTRTDRYKAVGAGAGDVNWISDWGNAMFGHAFEDYYLGATPMSNPQLYIEKSPLFRMDKVKTPTIIFFGTEDTNVPTEQGWQHYRAMQHLAITDEKFLLFPGEPHGLRKYVHQKRKVDEELAWFDRHLFGKQTETPAWLKQGSPLSGALHRTKLSEAPEMAVLGELTVSRFEITRAQYAAFDASYPVRAGTQHYPATGIRFEDAKRYVEWLSTRTGQKFRLPTEKEMASHLRGSKAGNTLDRWAGYDVNPDDAVRLAPTINGMDPDHLLLPVGSFAGKGDDPVFDLDGNAAEWVSAEDGSGKLLGGSADTPADAKLGWSPRMHFAGFRVVREEAAAR